MSVENRKVESMEDELRGRICVVTGAGGGIGRAICEAFGQAGGTVVALDYNATAGQETKAYLRGRGIEAESVNVDISSAADVDRVIAEVEKKYGSVDVL